MAKTKHIYYPLGDKAYYDENRKLRLIATGTCAYVEGDPKIKPNSCVNTHVILDAKTLKEITRFITYTLFDTNDLTSYIKLKDIVPLKNVFVLIESARLDNVDMYKTSVYNYKGKVLGSQVIRFEKFNKKEYVASIKEKYKDYVPEKSKK